MEKRALGRGISALIPEKENESEDRGLLVPLAKIKPNPLQPREFFDEEKMQELVQSIKEKGVIQPIVVRQKGDYYELIAGERRFRAANILNLKEIPVVIKDVGDQDSLEIALIENVQRENLNPIEEARAYQYLIEKFQITQERIGEVIGKSRSAVTNILRLLKLPQEIQEDIRQSRISFAHGRALIEIEDINYQRRLAQEVISKGLSVRELESIIKMRRPSLRRNRSRLATAINPILAVMEEELQRALATKVRISKRKKRGAVTIEFYSDEDLNRIVNRIKGGSSL